MSKISKNKLFPKLNSEALAILLGKIKEIKSIEDLEKFLDMFFTVGEKIIILKRLVVMILLTQKTKYRKIQDSLEISRTTISKIGQILSGHGYGKNIIHRKYSIIKRKEKQRKLFRPYKGVESII